MVQNNQQQSRVRKLLYQSCPHWYWPVPDYGDHIMMEVTEREKCRICRKQRIHAKIPEPHPTRNKCDVLEKLQHPGHEVVVEEWLPYGEKLP